MGSPLRARSEIIQPWMLIMMNLNSKVKSFIKNLFASLFIAPAQKCNAEASLAEGKQISAARLDSLSQVCLA